MNNLYIITNHYVLITEQKILHKLFERLNKNVCIGNIFKNIFCKKVKIFQQALKIFRYINLHK